MKKLFVAFLFLLLVGAVLGGKMMDHAGYVLITYDGNERYETSFWTALFLVILSFVVFHFTLKIIASLGKSNRRVKKWISVRNQNQKHRRVYHHATQGFIELAEGNWERAQRYLIQAAEDSETPLIYYLAAAKAAHEQGSVDKSNALLAKAQKTTPGAELAIGTSQAQFQLAREQLEQSLATLIRLRKSAPKQIYLLLLQQEVYLKLKDWESLQKLLPELRKQGVLEADQFIKLENTIYLKLIKRTSQRIRESMDDELNKDVNRKNQLKPLYEIWRKIPALLQRDETLLRVYIQALIDLGAHNKAAYLLKDALHRQWNNHFVYQFGLLESDDYRRQLGLAENWLKDHPNNATLLLTLGRLSLRNQLWDKARTYFEDCLKLYKSSELYGELGRLLAYMGDYQQSAHYYSLSINSNKNILKLDLNDNEMKSLTSIAK